MPKQTKAHTLRWFQNRVGKRIYRNPHKCCNHCDEIAQIGLIVHDLQHADSLYWYQNDFGNEDTILNYRDKL